VGKPEGKRLQGRPKCRWLDTIKWIFGRLDRMLWAGLIWIRIGTSGGALVNVVMNLQVP
jgi:hypothetical protein